MSDDYVMLNGKRRYVLNLKPDEWKQVEIERIAREDKERLEREAEEEARAKNEAELKAMMEKQPAVTVMEKPHSIILTITYKGKTAHFWAMTLDKCRQKANQWLAIEGYAEGL